VFSRTPSRAGLAALVSLALSSVMVLGLTVASTATATAAATTPTTACRTPEIVGGMYAVGATVSTPGAKARTLNESQATAFMQTWLAYSVFSSPPQSHPPANLPISQLHVSINQDGTPSTLLIFFATNGTKAWVGAPAPAPVPPPPNDQKWIRVPKPAETIAAFNGTMAPICADPTGAVSTTLPTSSTTLGLAVKPTGSSSGSGTWWILIIVGVLVLAAAAIAVSRVRRHRTA
jgi:hypothetical protein